jgi:glycosyltransferase involved in cell wall biosynthesis
LLSAFCELPRAAARITVVASSEVTTNLVTMGTPIARFANFYTMDVQGAQALTRRMPVPASDFAAMYTVFGPHYTPVDGPKNMMGFAQPWVAYPRNSAYSLLSPGQRVKSRLKYRIQAKWFSNADVLVVEHEHVRSALKEQRLFLGKQIEVVPNVVDSLILDPAKWLPVHLPPPEGELRLGIVSHDYPHKNLGILPGVREALKRNHGMDVEFWVTIADEAYQARPIEFRAAVKNIGPLQLAQSPSFYSALDGVIFPSLLECYSATPIETLATGTPLFASDRSFVRDTVGDHAILFDPLNPVDIAGRIADYFERPMGERTQAIEDARNFVTAGGYTSMDRAVATLQIIDATIAEATG